MYTYEMVSVMLDGHLEQLVFRDRGNLSLVVSEIGLPVKVSRVQMQHQALGAT